MHQGGCGAPGLTREEQILGLRPLVLGIAKRLASVRRLYPDFVQVGWIGAIKAVDAFDTTRSNWIDHYAGIRIRGEIIDYMRREDHLARRRRADVSAGEETPQEMRPLSLALIDLADSRSAKDFDRIEARLDVAAILRQRQIARDQKLRDCVHESTRVIGLSAKGNAQLQCRYCCRKFTENEPDQQPVRTRKLDALYQAGLSAGEAIQITGYAKNTVNKYYVRFKKRGTVMCECGRESTHGGRCSARRQRRRLAA